MSYQIEFSKPALKQLEKLSLDTQERIKAKIQELADNPRPHGVVKLKNLENNYRIKVGVYRVIYEIIDNILLITVLKVGHRREVYRDE
ncbi:addiction module toxin RelE [Scytonema hofmannii PCC 7110]|uniref:Addiction module toxin RelE n=1 Tax=Scytonema hofmannii PCC 7110 TaxID=128403 RepID=A0A139XF51_9CYAN|nr:type II toxin-antitoxin system RelE/ParE family toxin [Scytonema hofmannii]KYC43317.1 addiction module toxin RelE [Scytonema hofmannii PCC 7110]